MNILLSFIIGVVFGAVLVLVIVLIKQRQSEEHKTKEVENIITRIKESFGTLSLNALSKNSEEFLKLAHETLAKQTESGEKNLEQKKKLIDQTLDGVKKDLKNVEELVINFEKDREKKYGELSESLKVTAEQTGKLQETTNELRTALASSKVRGKWGEKIADDILRAIGFIEGINYLKQKQQASSKTIPDFTFLLPQNLKVNMDVKFPLDNYLLFLKTENDTDRNKLKQQFFKDVKNKIKEVTTRDYINPEENTLDYVIVFIPNEQIYGFINEQDNTLLDEALQSKVILCSPFTLYAVLSVIRQSIDNFNVDQTAAEILRRLGVFYQQWQKFIDSFEKIGKKIDEAQEEFGKLTSTRKNTLEKSLKGIEDLRKQTETADEIS